MLPYRMYFNCETTKGKCPQNRGGQTFHTKARFGKTVEAAGRTLIGKEGEDLFSFFFGDHSPRTNVISKIRSFHLVFHFYFAPLRLIFLKITAIRDL